MKWDKIKKKIVNKIFRQNCPKNVLIFFSGKKNLTKWFIGLKRQTRYKPFFTASIWKMRFRKPNNPGQIIHLKGGSQLMSLKFEIN